MKKLYALVFIFFINSFIFGFQWEEPLQVYDTLEHNYSWISFVQDAHGNKFMVKQVKSWMPYNQFDLVLDAFGSYIAESINISCNRVRVIKAGVDCIGKERTKYPATIHTLAPGVLVTNYKGIYRDLDIHQKSWPKTSARARKWGPLPSERKGLTLNIIKQMARHPDLPAIVAFDTFIGNTDESTTNLFYDVTTDRFCSVDFGDSCKRSLCKCAIRLFQSLIADNVVLNDNERKAVIAYKDTLARLVTTLTPKTLCQKFNELFEQAGFFTQKHLTSELLAYVITFYKKNIKESYQNAKKLIITIDNFLSII